MIQDKDEWLRERALVLCSEIKTMLTDGCKVVGKIERYTNELRNIIEDIVAYEKPF